jgi:Cof subfamily protein (haloacid dehalogenase superfamily)
VTAAATAPGGADPRPPHWRWLVTDLDGTLVDREQKLVARSVAALARFRALGGRVVIATGRNERSAGRYHRELGLDTPLILYNGARVVTPSGERLLDLDLGDDWPRLRDRVLPALPAGVGAAAFAGTDAYAVRPAEVLAEYARRDGITLCAGGPPAGAAVTKVLLVGPESGLGDLAAAVTAECPAATLVRSEATYLEVLPAGASKGTALAWLARRHGVELSRIAAIGDNPNDIDMVTTAGLGAAVGDGHERVRAVADLVTGACADGAVADLVARLLAGPVPVQEAPHAGTT